jgi:predicted alpha/beta superfamily hydrolase
MKLFSIALIFSFINLAGCVHSHKLHTAVIRHYTSFSSSYVQARNVEIMLPPGYSPKKKYDVLYMHDGQNVFDTSTAFTHTEWQVDETITALLKTKKIRPVIVVASWCTDKRFAEYMPNKPAYLINEAKKSGALKSDLLSDDYLKFIVYELKPYVDKNFSTYTTPKHTWIMGSSMGGLISCYAVCEYPNVFGGAACLSTHWPALDGIFLEYLKDHLPDPSTHKFYFDHGTVTLDSLYQPYQKRVDSMVINRGYEKNKNWVSLQFEGAEHSEWAWQKRVNIPLEFLLKN